METILADLEQQLYGSNDQVFLRVYQVPFSDGSTIESDLRQALGPETVVGGTVPVTGDEMWDEIESSLRYEGDRNAGPPAAKLHLIRSPGIRFLFPIDDFRFPIVSGEEFAI